MMGFPSDWMEYLLQKRCLWMAFMVLSSYYPEGLFIGMMKKVPKQSNFPQQYIGTGLLF